MSPSCAPTTRCLRRTLACLEGTDRDDGAGIIKFPALAPGSKRTTKDRSMKIGVCGTGKMGAAIAQRLMSCSHKITVWNRDPAKTQPQVSWSKCRCIAGGVVPSLRRHHHHGA